MAPSLASLPREAMVRILHFVHFSDIVSVSETCQGLHNLIKNADEVWADALPPPPEIVSPEPAGPSSLSTFPASPHSPHLTRLKHVTQHGEFSEESRSRLMVPRRSRAFRWAYVTLGSHLSDIVWGDGDPVESAVYWRRDMERHEAHLHTVWWFDVSTDWAIPLSGRYRAFVVHSRESRRPLWPMDMVGAPLPLLDPPDSMRNVQVFAGGRAESEKYRVGLGRLVGEGGGEIDMGASFERRRFLFVSPEFEVQEGSRMLKVSLVDHDCNRCKMKVQICAVGLFPVEGEAEVQETVREGCVEVYRRALQLAEASRR